MINIIKKQLPEHCKKCFGNNFIEITNIEKQTLYCPNLLPNGECILQCYIKEK